MAGNCDTANAAAAGRRERNHDNDECDKADDNAEEDLASSVDSPTSCDEGGARSRTVEIQCSLCCEGRNLVESSLSRHVKSHAVLQPFSCGHCGQVAPSLDLLREHHEGAHPSLPQDALSADLQLPQSIASLQYRCGWCPYACNTSNRLTRHIWTHIRYSCAQCSFSSESLPKLKEHFLERHPRQRVIAVILEKMDCITQDTGEDGETLKQRFFSRKRYWGWTNLAGSKITKAPMVKDSTKMLLKQILSSSPGEESEQEGAEMEEARSEAVIKMEEETSKM